MITDVGYFSVTGPSSDLAALLETGWQPAWHADAACKEHPELSWFPERGEVVDKQKAVCAGCSVRQECLNYALSDERLFGVWGGMSTRQRRRLRAATRAGVAA